MSDNLYEQREVCARQRKYRVYNSGEKQFKSIRDSFLSLEMRLAARILTRYPASVKAHFSPFPWCRSHRSFLDYFLENQFARRDCFLASPVLHNIFVLLISRSFHFLVEGSGRASGTDFSPAPFVNLPDLYFILLVLIYNQQVYG